MGTSAPGETRGGRPFADVLPAVVVAAPAAATAGVWGVAAAVDRPLPGGRWVVVHLLTLGVITPLVLAFTQHFGRTLARSASPELRTTAPAAVGALLVLGGLTTDRRWATAVGATALTVVVLLAYRHLRGMRREAVGARFAWIVRLYERAHGAFVHGAVLGLLMGTGMVRGDWYGSARLAHLHANVLGWAGLTLLATLVFFGPSIARARIVAGAEDRAASALRRGATGLSAATVLLLLTAVGGAAGTGLRLAAAAGLAAYAVAVTVVCADVARAAVATRRSRAWPLVLLVAVVFPPVAWADVAIVATGRWAWLPRVGLVVFAGVLLPAITATTIHVVPLIRPRRTRRQPGLGVAGQPQRP